MLTSRCLLSPFPYLRSCFYKLSGFACNCCASLYYPNVMCRFVFKVSVWNCILPLWFHRIYRITVKITNLFITNKTRLPYVLPPAMIHTLNLHDPGSALAHKFLHINCMLRSYSLMQVLNPKSEVTAFGRPFYRSRPKVKIETEKFVRK